MLLAKRLRPGQISGSPSSCFLGALTTMTELDPAAKGDLITLSNNNLTAYRTAGGWRGVMGTVGHSTGKFVLEFHPTNAQHQMFGIADANFDYTKYSSNNRQGSVYTNLLAGIAANMTLNYTDPFLPSYDTPVLFAVDIDARKMWAYTNGSWVVGDPETGASPFIEWNSADITLPMYPVIQLYGVSEVTINTGQSAMLIDPLPAGFCTWNAYS